MTRYLIKKPVLCWLFLFILTLVACDSNDSKTLGKQDSKPIRLITLSPHLAELVASAGALKNLVGVVSYSDFPKAVEHITHVGDAFKLDYEQIIALQPDYILTWKGGTPIAILEKLRSLNFTIIETEINALSDIPKTIDQIAQLSNTANTAKANINQFNQTLLQLQQKPHKTQSTFIETYHKPLYTVSGKHWISQAVAICGYQNIFQDLSQLSVPVTLESVISKNPQSIINIAKQKDPQWQNWQNLAAVKNQKIITIDPDFLSRPSMRILLGIEQLCDSGSRF